MCLAAMRRLAIPTITVYGSKILIYMDLKILHRLSFNSILFEKASVSTPILQSQNMKQRGICCGGIFFYWLVATSTSRTEGHSICSKIIFLLFVVTSPLVAASIFPGCPLHRGSWPLSIFSPASLCGDSISGNASEKGCGQDRCFISL